MALLSSSDSNTTDKLRYQNSVNLTRLVHFHKRICQFTRGNFTINLKTFIFNLKATTARNQEEIIISFCFTFKELLFLECLGMFVSPISELTISLPVILNLMNTFQIFIFITITNCILSLTVRTTSNKETVNFGTSNFS